jgi:hypothetical protein
VFTDLLVPIEDAPLMAAALYLSESIDLITKLRCSTELPTDNGFLQHDKA